MIKVKGGVTPANLIIVAAAANVAEQMGILIVITSGTDGKHMKNSRHYTSEAIDFRTSNISKVDRPIFIAQLKERLGPKYDVIDEGDHIHVELD